MTIHLPENLERSILAAVHSGRYATVDEAMSEAASMLVQRLCQERAQGTPSPSNPSDTTPKRKPIWEVAEEIRRSIPSEEWSRLPADGAEQLHHYLYGTPKRPRV